jgi:hypothetical protein
MNFSLSSVLERIVRVLLGASFAVGLVAGRLGRVRVAHPQVFPQALRLGGKEPVGIVGGASLLLLGKTVGRSGFGAGGVAESSCHR